MRDEFATLLANLICAARAHLAIFYLVDSRVELRWLPVPIAKNRLTCLLRIAFARFAQSDASLSISARGSPAITNLMMIPIPPATNIQTI